MKLLLDENLPRKMKKDLANHEVFTVRDMRWDGKENGELLALMLANGFEALVSGDKNIPFQQNFQKYPIPIIVLDAPDNTYDIRSGFLCHLSKRQFLQGLCPDQM